MRKWNSCPPGTVRLATALDVPRLLCRGCEVGMCDDGTKLTMKKHPAGRQVQIEEISRQILRMFLSIRRGLDNQ